MNSISKVLFLSAAAVLLAVVVVCLSDDSEGSQIEVVFEEGITVICQDRRSGSPPYVDVEIENSPALVDDYYHIRAIRTNPEYGNIYMNGVYCGPVTEITEVSNYPEGIHFEIFRSDYVINFDGNGGEGDAPSPINNLKNEDEYALLTIPFSKIGMQALVWNTMENGEGDDYQPGMHTIGLDFIRSHYSLTNNEMTLYPKWVPIDYSVVFHPVENIVGTVPSAITGKQIGSILSINPASFSRSGYTMIGWTNIENGTSVLLSEGEYNLDAEFITNVFGSNSTVTLYPVWTLNTYSISLKTERGHGIGWAAENGSFVSSYSVESDEIVLPVPESDDRFHTFINWEDNNGNPVSKIAAGSTGNLDLKAVWIEKSFPITITINGKTASYDMTISSTMPEAEPEAGFELKGWYYKDSDGNEVQFESMSQIDEGMSIYAVFVPTPDDPKEILIGAGALILFFLITTIYAYTRN